MPSYNTDATADNEIPCTQEEYDRLSALLAQEPDGDQGEHGFTIDRMSTGFYLWASDHADPDCFPQAFCDLVGEILTRAKTPWLQIGLAFTGSKHDPMSHGGTDFRIYCDGSSEYATKKWSREEAAERFLSSKQ